MAACGLSEFVARIARAVDGASLARGGGLGGVHADLLERFRVVSDGRSDVGRDHPVAAVLTLAAAAVVAGIRSFAAIAGAVADTPAQVLASLYARCGSDTRRPPSPSTIWRVITGADADAVDAAVGAYLADQRGDPVAGEALAVDGKTVRGAVDAEGNQVHLMSATTHADRCVLAQTDVAAKTNEIPCFTSLLDRIDITGTVVTADALHTQRGHAEYLRGRNAHFVFIVKDNQPRLFDAIDAMPWDRVTIGHEHTERGHGRTARRTMRVLPAPSDLPFPHVKTVFLLERYVTDNRTGRQSAVAELGVTSLHANAPTLAAHVKGHWGVEVLHWIRDTVYTEDHSKTRTRSGPRVMATLRNLAIGALRQAGHTTTAEASRWAARRPERPFTILGLTP